MTRFLLGIEAFAIRKVDPEDANQSKNSMLKEQTSQSLEG